MEHYYHSFITDKTLEDRRITQIDNQLCIHAVCKEDSIWRTFLKRV